MALTDPPPPELPPTVDGGPQADRLAWFLPFAARLLVLLVASGPASVAASGFLAAGPARSPWYVDAGRPLPAIQLLRLLGDLGPAVAAAAAAGVAVAWLGQQLVTAGAVAALDPARRGPAWPAFLAGSRHLGAYLRVALLGALLLGVGVGGLGLAFSGVRAALPPAATADLRFVLLPAAQALAGLLWASLVGAAGLHLRVRVVLSGDPAVRRALAPTARFWRAHPGVGPGLYVAFALASTLVAGVTLGGWRQSGGALGWRLATVAGLALQSAGWVAVVRETVRAMRAESR